MIIHAPFIHTGGGKTLLNILLKQNNIKSIFFYLDRKLIFKNIDHSHFSKIKNNFFHSLFPKKYYTEKKHLFFHGLPPLFRRKKNINICFFQNIFLIKKNNTSNVSFKEFFKIYLKRFYFILFLNNFDYFIVQSESSKNLLKKLLIKKKINKKIEILTLFEFNEVLPINHKKAYDFIYPAEFLPHKNHINLIKAFIRLSSSGIYPSLVLTISKKNIPKILDNKIDENKLKIFFFENLERSDFLSIFSQSRALIYPSFHESLGIPLLEAESMSIPIIASELDFVRDLINPNETFNPNSDISIERAIKRFLKINNEKFNYLNSHKFIERVISY